jgi:hypothetical protein
MENSRTLFFKFLAHRNGIGEGDVGKWVILDINLYKLQFGGALPTSI